MLDPGTLNPTSSRSYQLVLENLIRKQVIWPSALPTSNLKNCESAQQEPMSKAKAAAGKIIMHTQHELPCSLDAAFCRA